MSLEVLALQSKDIAKWDAYVEKSDQSTFFHRAGWKEVLEKAFGHSTHFLFAERDGVVEGILPLAHVKSMLFGNNLVSLPFCVYGGLVADSDEVAIRLINAASSLADDLKVDALELRNTSPSGQDWPSKSLYYTFRKEITGDNEANMLSIPRKRRAMIRQGIKAGLSSEADDGWERVYNTYAESVRNLGTPVFSAKYFRVLREVFKEDCRVLMITHDGEDVAGLMSFYFKDQVLPYYAGSYDSAKTHKAHDFMYWELMRRASDEGVRLFDFGRSKEGTGPFLFKKGWGFEPELLHYEYYLVKATSIPEVNPNNPKYKLFIDAWKKLPVPIANKLGPLLSRSLG
ncbi:FemAB family XrtA/PEP-CTERM system-associated protein [Neptunomonas japonica]|uniref:Peptidoglycan bridge formation protein FemAB n=1 Tax=Neptunomonas japonica JAMM 1380 TaxID=1441457 RepID=A0A7R6PA93_9GAMM|nr:FemAB family XrtA/PEP-CTERM system-associated protein [Neptunomonas japonica]BBB28749.1 peptidoglycan bridge formation protein FemAB [Neptunomonas japonica JAMM 1380]